jgi:hypothetical protein
MGALQGCPGVLPVHVKAAVCGSPLCVTEEGNRSKEKKKKKKKKGKKYGKFSKHGNFQKIKDNL